MKKAFVIVLNWNGWSDTNACLDSLARLDYPRYQVVVVDNASTDDSVERIRAAHPEVTLLQSGGNLGFAGGNNVGIRHALEQGADYVWLLNNDAVADPHALTALVELAERDPSVGAVGSRIFYMDRPTELQAWGGGWANVWTGRSSEHHARVSERELDYLTGCSLLLTRAALERSGLLDDRFFLYFEDTELSFRYRRDGWRLAVAEDSKVWHRGGGTSKRISRPVARYRTQSLLRFLRLHSPSFLVSAAVSTALRGTSFALRGNVRELRNLGEDLVDFARQELKRARAPEAAPAPAPPRRPS